jgi:hypothetical protein
MKNNKPQVNKFAVGLALAGAAVGLVCATGVAISERASTEVPVQSFAVATSTPEVPAAPEPEPVPSFRDGLSYTDQLVYDAAQRQVEKCDQEWLPSTCAKMRAEFKSELGWEF